MINFINKVNSYFSDHYIFISYILSIILVLMIIYSFASNKEYREAWQKGVKLAENSLKQKEVICDKGIVTGKKHRNSYTTFVPTGKTVIPIHHSEQWYFELDERCWLNVSEFDFNQYMLGDDYD